MVVRDILNIAGPPRPVPLLVRLRVLFGGFINQFGWFFFGFGLIFVWAFTLKADLTSWYVFRGRLENAEGVITTSRKTNMSVGGSKHSDGMPVYGHSYRFVGPDGIEYKGISYQTGGGLREGQKVTIELCFIVAGFRKGTKQTGCWLWANKPLAN